MNAPTPPWLTATGTGTDQGVQGMLALAQILPHALLVLDTQRRVTWVNDAFSHISGRAADECLGLPLDELLGWDATGGATSARLRSALSEPVGSAHVLSMCRLDGQRLWVQADLYPLGARATEQAAWGVTLVDLTSRPLGLPQLRSVLGGSAAPAFVCDEGGIVRECNAAAASLFGVDAAALIGTDVQSLPWRVTDGEGIDLPADWLPEIVTLQTAQPIQDFPIGALLADGRRRWLNVTTALLGREPGAPPWVVSTFADITDRREMQADLDRQWKRLLASLEGSLIATWEWNVHTGEAQFDERAAQIIGEPPEAMWPPTIETWRVRVHTEDQVATRALLEAHFDGLVDSYEQEMRLLHADGSWRWVRDRGRLGSRLADGTPEWMYGTREDISDRKQAELAAARDHALLQALFDLSPVGIELVDLEQSRSIMTNAEVSRITGHSAQVLAEGREDNDLCPRWIAHRQTWFAKALAHNRFGPAEVQIHHADGHPVDVVANGMRVNVGGRDHLWLTVQDVTAARAMERELRKAAHEDRLTGLANRASVLRELHALDRRARLSPDEGFSLLFLDFDRFKMVNDTLGHDAGDELLRGIAERLREACTSTDGQDERVAAWLPARLGGDEFVVLVPGVTERPMAQAVADRLLEMLAAPYRIKQQQIHSSASIGIAVWQPSRPSADDLLRDADIAMYEAKRQGRRRAVFFDEQMHARIARIAHIENALRDALTLDQMHVAYQPIVDLQDGATQSAEALLRWNHPELGAVGPGEFIPIAEESGQILALGEWVLRKACADWAEWHRQAESEAPRTVSVNLSRVQLSLGTSFVETVRAALGEVGMPAHALQLEITEREVLRDQQATRELMHGLRELGVKLAMDDFGTGASSLGCLREFPFDTIKIDKSFVTGLCQDPQVMTVAHATVHVIENLGMVSVAEGIEDPAEVAALQALGCRCGQGYLFARPMPADKLLEAMRRPLV